MTMKRRTLSITAAFFLLFLYHSATAQTSDSLAGQRADSLTVQSSTAQPVVFNVQQCIDSALKNNALVKTAEFTARTAQVGYLQQIGNMLPTLGGYAQYLNNGGKSVNTVTYTYVTENYNQGYGQLTGSLILWNGGSIQNFIRQYSLAYKADQKDWQYQKDLITINIILDYLNVLSTKEQLDLSIKQAADQQSRVNLMKIQDSLGSIPPTTLTDAKGLLATNELTIVSEKNALETNKLKLAQDMNIPYSPNIDLIALSIDASPALYNAACSQCAQGSNSHPREHGAHPLSLLWRI